MASDGVDDVVAELRARLDRERQVVQVVMIDQHLRGWIKVSAERLGPEFTTTILRQVVNDAHAELMMAAPERTAGLS